MKDPFQVVRDFESALCDYTGAPYCVTTTSCTMALLLACAWHLRGGRLWSTTGEPMQAKHGRTGLIRQVIEIPKRTYVGVPMSIIHAGGKPIFRDEQWKGAYQLRPLPVYDSARWFTGGMYSRGQWVTIAGVPNAAQVFGGNMLCVSFHHTKTLGLAAHGGAILHDSPEADAWLRRARFDGRAEGVAPKDDTFPMTGWHCYMTPPTAAEGLMRLRSLPRHNEPLPNDDYPDLSQLEIFR